MRPIVAISIAFGAALLAVFALPAEMRIAAWTTLGAAYLLISTWGIVSVNSGIFGRAHTRGSADARVALTYDDGPDPNATAALLDLLKERGVKAAFFVVGKKVRAHGEVARRCHEEGHLLANHSDGHSLATNFFGPARMRKEIEACQAALREITGAPARYYRPPVGLMSPSVWPAVRALGLELVGWQVRSLDTTGRDAAAVARRVLERIRSGGIILLHDGGLEPERVVEITRLILDGLAERKLEPVRVDELVGVEPSTPL